MPLENHIIKNSNDAKMGVLIAGSADSVHILKNILSILYKYTTEKRRNTSGYNLPMSVIAGIHHIGGMIFGADYLQGLYLGDDKENPLLRIHSLEEHARVGNSGIYIARAVDTEITPTLGMALHKGHNSIYSVNLDLLLKTGADYFNKHEIPYCSVIIRGMMSDGVSGFSEAMSGKMAIAGIIEDPAKIKQYVFGEMPRGALKRMRNKLSAEEFNKKIILARGEVIGDILIYQLGSIVENGK